MEFSKAAIARIAVSSRPNLISGSIVTSHNCNLSIRQPVSRVCIITSRRSFRKRNVFNVSVHTDYTSVTNRISAFNYMRFCKEIVNVIVLKSNFNGWPPVLFTIFADIFITLTVSTFRKPCSHCFFAEQSFGCILSNFKLGIKVAVSSKKR